MADYIDVHAHFADEGYDEPAELGRMRAAGVRTVILAGDTLAHSAAHAKLAETYGGVYFTAGVHPSETADFGEEALVGLRALCRSEKCVAVGEIGLDYHYPDADRKRQREAFLSQLVLADEEGLPVQIHSRDCAADMLAILREMKGYLKNGFLLHCYSHGAEMMDDFTRLGAYYSFGGVCCFRNARSVWESVCRCPSNRLLSETDSPYLSPERGAKNSPCNIPLIVSRIAELRGEDEAYVKENIFENARALFGRIS